MAAKDSEKKSKKEEKTEEKNDAEAHEDENEEEEQKTATAAKTAKDMSNVTRYFNGDQEGQGVDEAKLTKAIGEMSKANSSRAAATPSTHVKLQKEDIELVINELEVPRPTAEKLLRENNGDVFVTLNKMVSA